MSPPRLPHAPHADTVIDVRTKLSPEAHARLCVVAGLERVSVTVMVRRLILRGLDAWNSDRQRAHS